MSSKHRIAAFCSECGASGDLRPYGKGGALVCFPCGMKDEATTKAEFAKRLDEAGPVVILTADGPMKARKEPADE